MITIDAHGKDGRNILPDLDGASPTGGYVSSEYRPRHKLTVGDVIRDHDGAGGQWSVIADIRHNGIIGISHVGIIRADGTSHVWILVPSDGADVRTDTRIDPDTLWRIAPAEQGERPFAVIGGHAS